MRNLGSSILTTTCLLLASAAGNAGADELVAHWTLDGTFDNAANAEFNGTGTGVTFVAVEANEGGFGPVHQTMAAQFTGVNTQVVTAYPGIGGTNARTVTLWVKTAAPGLNDFLGYGAPTNGNKWHMRVNTVAGNGPIGGVRTEYQGGQLVGGDRIDDGVWHHIAAVFPEGSTDGHQIIHYVDGIRQGNNGTNRGISTLLNAANYPVTIGVTRQSLTVRRWCNGLIADVRIYDFGLTDDNIGEVIRDEELSEPVPCSSLVAVCTPSEVTNTVDVALTLEPAGCICPSVEVAINGNVLGTRSVVDGGITLAPDEICNGFPDQEVELSFTCLGTKATATCSYICPARQGLVAHWPLATGEGVVFPEVQGGFDGFLTETAEGVAWGEGPPIQDFAVEFSGTNSWIQTDFPGIGGRNPRTVAAWIKTTLVSTANNGIVAWGQDLSTRKWHVRMHNGATNAGALRVEVNGGFKFGSTVINDGEWHHIAVILPEGGSMISDTELYVDGRLETQTTFSELAIDTNADTGRTVEIGRRVNGNGSQNYFPGSIADVRIYDDGLDALGVENLVLGDDCRVLRSLGAQGFVPGDTISVSLSPRNFTGQVDIVETFPEGLSVADAGGGTVDGQTITFTMDPDNSAVLTYVLEAGPEFCDDFVITGTYSVVDDCSGDVGGSTDVICACPETGDTHCLGLTVDPPSAEVGGSFTVSANATDDSGDTILYTFTATSEMGEFTSGPAEASSVVFDLVPAEWTITVSVDDDLACSDVADDASCTEVLSIACPEEGDTHCDSLEVEQDGSLVDTGTPQPEGLYTLLAGGTDDSGDGVFYTFTASGPEGDITVGPVMEFLGVAQADFELGRGLWSLQVRVDDNPDCDDEAADVLCAQTLQIGPPPGRQVPGDCNQDGILDISDPVCVLGSLFLGVGELPCGNGDPRDPVVVGALSVNGDEVVDLSDAVYVLSYLFAGGPEPVSGLVCISIPGCPTVTTGGCQ
ncbi:MAG: LamG domain-containing protein [Planctomycetota bacterium]